MCAVGIATRYWLNGPVIECRWGRDFPHPSRPALRPTQSPIQWLPGISRGQSGRGVTLTTHPHLAPRLKKEKSYTSTPPLDLRGLFYGRLYLYLYVINPLNPELNPICYLLTLLGAHHFLHVSRIRVKSLTFRRLMSYIYGAPILDVSRSHTTTQHSR